MFYFPEVPKNVLGRGKGGGVKSWYVGIQQTIFCGRPNGCSVWIKIPSLGIIRIGCAASRVRS